MRDLLETNPPKTEDDRIHDDVCRQIVWQTDIQSHEINVEVKGSVVLLSGSVETCLERIEAENAAKAVYGVASVTNEIRVEPKRARTDHEIADDVVASLRMVTYVLEEPPIVSVQDGVVTLRGRVRWNFQRQSAERAADAIVGVRGVRNMIEIELPNPLVPCRKPNRRLPDSTPSSKSFESATSTHPMFFVPFVIGRA